MFLVLVFKKMDFCENLDTCSLNCMNDYLAVDSGEYLHMHNLLQTNCSMAEWFTKKSR